MLISSPRIQSLTLSLTKITRPLKQSSYGIECDQADQAEHVGHAKNDQKIKKKTFTRLGDAKAW